MLQEDCVAVFDDIHPDRLYKTMSSIKRRPHNRLLSAHCKASEDAASLSCCTCTDSFRLIEVVWPACRSLRHGSYYHDMLVQYVDAFCIYTGDMKSILGTVCKAIPLQRQALSLSRPAPPTPLQVRQRVTMRLFLTSPLFFVSCTSHIRMPKRSPFLTPSKTPSGCRQLAPSQPTNPFRGGV